MKLEITFIVCGGTGNPRGTDKPLSREVSKRIMSNARRLAYPPISRVYTCAYASCREAAAAIYPKIPALLANGIRDFDFGELTGKSRRELISSPEFEKWAGSADVLPFPGGEPPDLSRSLSLKEFAEIIDDLEHSNVGSAAIVAPKGVILIILNRYLLWGNGYHGMNLGQGGGCVCAYDTALGSIELLKVI